MAQTDVRLPRTFTATHQTAGLPNFPAVDVFGQPGEPVLAPVSGTIVDVHGIPWNQREHVGGETAYLQGDDGNTYFLTHLQGNVPSGRVQAGQPIGQVAAVPGSWWPSHIHEGLHQGIYQPGGSSSPAPVAQTIAATAPAASTSAWPQSAQLAYRLAIQAGLNPTDAKDFASVQYGESGFDPTNYVGKSQGHSYVPYHTAGGLYQLLSKGYVDTANQLGGVFNPTANIKAILPNYVDYYKAHPAYVPGAAGATVEASGEPASYYAQGLQHLPGTAPVTAAMAATPTAAVGRQPAAAAPPTALAAVAPAQGLPSIVRKILGVPAGRSSPAPAAAPTPLPPIVRRILRS